jgi:hypothetical protein
LKKRIVALVSAIFMTVTISTIPSTYSFFTDSDESTFSVRTASGNEVLSANLGELVATLVAEEPAPSTEAETETTVSLEQPVDPVAEDTLASESITEEIVIDTPLPAPEPVYTYTRPLSLHNHTDQILIVSVIVDGNEVASPNLSAGDDLTLTLDVQKDSQVEVRALGEFIHEILN